MEKTKENALMNCSTLDELLNAEFGVVGTPVRDEFDKETEAFCLAQTLREDPRTTKTKNNKNRTKQYF